MLKKRFLFVIAILVLLLAACGGEEASEEVEKEVVSIDTSIPEREFTVGKSSEDFKELTKSKPQKVRNDATDKWKIITVADSVDLNGYILSYANYYFEEDDLVHVIVNFNYNTTTVMNDFGSYLDVRVHEYMDKEEHDAKKIGGGMLLGQYLIYKDNGDIVDFEEVVKNEESE